MSDGIRIKLSGLKPIQEALKRAVAFGKNPVDMLESMAQRYQERIDFRLDTKVDPSGTAWSPIKQSTKDRYATQNSQVGNGGGRGSLLVRTGLMRASLSRQVLARSVLVGFGRSYAIHHEFGTKYMQRRGMMFSDPQSGQLSQADIDAMLKTGFAYLKTIGL
jgi:phage gpG-like protein